MMKKLLVGVIIVYQQLVSPCLKQFLGVGNVCRFSPTCSEYTKTVILRYGVIRGMLKTMIRVAQCQPYIESKKAYGKYL